MLKSLEINGFKSFANKSTLEFKAPISAIVGPNGSGKSNAAEAFRFVLGEQSLKSLRVQNSDELLYNGGQGGRRANRAHVKATLDNSDGQLNIDYDEVVIERIIERSDASTYRINGSQVRLKDVTDLLSDANIGTSRHHIISQGETDRVLNVNERKRKSIIEDALGLQRFYRRRREAINKLEKTEHNLEEARVRLNDLKPELEYLEKQKSRIEETKELRQKLTTKYRHFFRRETTRLKAKEKAVAEKKTSLEKKKEKIKSEIEDLKQEVKQIKEKKHEESKNQPSQKERELQEELSSLEDKISKAIQEHGEVVGTIKSLKKQQEQSRRKRVSIEVNKFSDHRQKLEELIDKTKKEEGGGKIKILDKLITAVQNLLGDMQEPATDNTDYSKRIESLKSKKDKLEKKRKKLKDKQSSLKQKQSNLKKEAQDQQVKEHKAEKKLVRLKAELDSISKELSRAKKQIKRIKNDKNDLEDEKSEARILCGKEVLNFEDVPLVDNEGNSIDREDFIENIANKDRTFNRDLERLKIKLEDTRVSDHKEVLSEYDRIKEQVDFLREEIDDLKESKSSLLSLIEEIETTVKTEFTEGIEEINEIFSEFFATMFGGGEANLTITKHPKGKNERVGELEETPEEIERGVAIDVKLPQKKVRGLGVLSGGERVLVSVALLFALSQINPPPFIVLDEADAALDEANSQRFGEMIERLSNRSQLVIITHNRETMRRADVLYGITLDKEGGSRLLSLDFSEAVEKVTG